MIEPMPSSYFTPFWEDECHNRRENQCSNLEKRCEKNYSSMKRYAADPVNGKLIQKLLLDQKYMGYLVHAYYSISPISYYKDDSCWSADLKSKTTEDIISIGSFMEVIVLNQYVLVRKILSYIPLLAARLICHKALINDVQEHMREGSLVTSERIDTLEQEVETLCDRAEKAEIMPTTRQGMSSAEIEQIIAQRVTSSIEVIAIYEIKIHVAHDSMDRVVCQQAKVAKNDNNKRKWESK
ncbi:hypothetical protein Tco_1213155 [Tanacetum coccineum]